MLLIFILPGCLSQVVLIFLVYFKDEVLDTSSSSISKLYIFREICYNINGQFPVNTRNKRFAKTSG